MCCSFVASLSNHLKKKITKTERATTMLSPVQQSDIGGKCQQAVNVLSVCVVVTSGAHTIEWGDLTTCQDGTPRDLSP